MMNTLSFSMLLIFMWITLTAILYFVSYKSIIDSEKMSPSECGFDPFASRIPFSSNYFMIAVIFLIFYYWIRNYYASYNHYIKYEL